MLDNKSNFVLRKSVKGVKLGSATLSILWKFKSFIPLVISTSGWFATYRAFYLSQHQFGPHRRPDQYLPYIDRWWIPNSERLVKIQPCQERRNVPSHQPKPFYCHCWNLSPKLLHSIAGRMWTKRLERGKEENWYNGGKILIKMIQKRVGDKKGQQTMITRTIAFDDEIKFALMCNEFSSLSFHFNEKLSI